MKIQCFFNKIICGLLMLLFCSGATIAMPRWYRNAVHKAEHQMLYMISQTDVNARKCFPRTIKPDGRIQFVNDTDWTSGFFPGSLWLVYELTGNEILAKEARKFTNRLNEIQYYTKNHDVGFMMCCSYGNALRLKPENADTLVMVNAAKSLCTRFNPEIGLIRSWDSGSWNYPVIIDNMMNLELLFWASRQTLNDNFYNIAVAHADKTLENHFRENMTSYHVVSYLPNGKVESKGTHQGYSDESAWARGQAWGLYGYTMCYRFTEKADYLNVAHEIAQYIMSNRPSNKDYVPYWDYNAPDIPQAPRDASAAAITASALLELCEYTADKKLCDKYKKYAENILKQLSSNDYLAEKDTNSGFILKHSVGSLPHKIEIDVPLNYADYYFLEALLRYRRLKGF